MGRSARIDLLRGVAILLVLLHHFNIAFPLADTGIGHVLGAGFVAALARNGNYGVTIFFTVSGFLITRTAQHHWGRLARIAPLGFYRMRAARIMPPLLLLVALVTVLGWVGIEPFQNTHGVPVWLSDLAALTGWMNVLMAQADWFNYPLCVLWSLSVEMLFYALFPLLCRVARTETTLTGAFILLAIAGPVWRILHQASDAGYLYAYLACFDAIAIGCGTALLESWVRMRGDSAFAQQCAIAAAMAFFYLFRPVSQTNVFGASLMAFCTAMLLYPAARPRGDISDAIDWLAQPIRLCGRLCYELYLFHLVILAWLRLNVTHASSQTLLIYLAGSGAAALLISRFYARPLNAALAPRAL